MVVELDDGWYIVEDEYVEFGETLARTPPCFEAMMTVARTTRMKPRIMRRLWCFIG